jgi:hypothetical protein
VDGVHDLQQTRAERVVTKPDKPLPRQPEGSAPFELQRPSAEEISLINDPRYNHWGGHPDAETLSARLIVLDRYTHQVPDPEHPGRHITVPGTFGYYEVHGDMRVSMYKTWSRARTQALGSNGARPGAIMLFDLRQMPVVTTEAEMRQALKRPVASRVWAEEDEAMFAERMAGEWMRYSKEVAAEMMSGASPNIAADGQFRDPETSKASTSSRARSPGRCDDCDPSFGCWTAGPAGDGRPFRQACQKRPPAQPQDDGEARAVDRGNARSSEQDAGL